MDENRPKLQDDDPKFKKVVEAADDLSLGLSMVVAVLLGVGFGYLLRKWFSYDWLFWFGVFIGISAAILNVYKVYKKQKRELDKLAKDPKYARYRYDESDEDD